MHTAHRPLPAPRAASATDILSSASFAQVKAAICENINLYLEKNETEFADYVEVFAKLVWELLLKVRFCGRDVRCGS